MFKKLCYFLTQSATFADDIQRFSAPDNYWCYIFERAVRSYVERSSNKKNLEMTFAKAESRKELLKFSSQPSLTISPSQLTQCEHTGSPQGCLQQVNKSMCEASQI